MQTNSQWFEAYLKCPTKSWLLSRGETGAGNAYAEWVKAQNEVYRSEGLRRLRETVPDGEQVLAPPPDQLKTAKGRLAIDLATGVDNLPPRIDAVQRQPLDRRGEPALFIPIRFLFRNKLTRDDRLLLAFDALALSELAGRDLRLGKIIHGDDHITLEVKTTGLLGEVRDLAGKLAQMVASSSPPDLVLNRHCGECEFRDRCRQKAVEKDDLSLLAGMTGRERKKFHKKGIFTVTQLSYTFRPRRRRKRMRDKREKYHHSLKALAIREEKIHVVGRPELNVEGTPCYLDVEGIPDRDFYYLIGVRIGNGESSVQHSLWADTVGDERTNWRELLAIFEAVDRPVLIHYGSYETTFLQRMCERYGEPPKDSVGAKAIYDAINLISVTFARVYFPTFSNGLKEIARYCGFRWSDPSASGLEAIRWRQAWAASGAPASKLLLLTYNAEDCGALEILASKVIELSQTVSEAEGSSRCDVVDTAKLKREHPYGFKRNTFAFPELDAINKAAYWDYQRERIYVKSHANVKRALRRAAKPPKVLPPNKTIECPRPRQCPKCSSADFFKHTKYSKTVLDLKFMRHGIKRWILRYRFHRYQCQSCGTVFQPKETCWGKSKYGSEIMAYALYLNIELRLPQMEVASKLNRLFGFSLGSSIIGGFKAKAAANHKGTYEKIIRGLCGGRLLHADETKASVKDNDGFVWVFANMEAVAYVYTETREGAFLQTLLKDFTGVLVSDFYAAYDAIDCPQQKCLIHLIRDMNDDVLKHPYDEELKGLALAFGVLLKPMVETIDRFGLKRRFLTKYLITVDRFYRQVANLSPHSEPAVKLRDRLQKNRNKLFTFLGCDGVPWNNNNAEHAVKPFAMLRQVIAGVTTEKGIRDYLVLLSICETCKYMGLDFLDFLRSGETDIQAFAAEQPKRRRRRPEQPC